MSAAANVLQDYLSALRAGNRRQAIAIIDDAHAGGCTVRELYLHVFQPALREIGRLWEQNVITVADEHLATAITQMAMARLYDDICTAARPNGRLLVAACAETERHEVGLRMICDFAEMEGWEIACLGSSVPLESLTAMVRDRRPHAVALSVAVAPHLPQLQSAISGIRSLGGETPFILAGGRPFIDDPALARRLDADATARDAHEALERLRERFG